MSQVQEFSGVDFNLVLGEVYGIRAWQLDKLGRLRALHLSGVDPWRPGVNVAACRSDKDPFGSGMARGGFAFTLSSFYMAAGLTPPSSTQGETSQEPPQAEEHLVPNEGCRCGFYAYTDVDHEENQADKDNRYVLGVVRGTGRTLVGTKGFRCERAEIVGLLDPTRGGLRLAKWRREQRRLLRRVYPDVPLYLSRRELVAAHPIDSLAADPSTDEFWTLP